MMASGRTRLARIGKTTEGIAGAATKARLAKTSSATTRVETTRVVTTSSATTSSATTRGATGTRKAAAAAAAGGVVGIARTDVTAVAAATWNATTSR